jgi:acetyl-CoA synthase
MSTDVLVQLGTKGAQIIIELTKKTLDEAIRKKGTRQNISFPETNYSLPLINALLKMEVKTLQDCQEVLKQAENLNNNLPAQDGFKIDSLGGLLNKGIATLLCEEILASLKYLNREHPQKDYVGFLSDTLLRSLGIQLVDGRIAGIAVILGPAKDADSAVQLIRDFQNRSIVSILVGNVNSNTLKKQLESKNVELGLENYIVPLGEDYLSAIYAVDWAVRAPLMYGGLKSGQWREILRYAQEKVPAFVVLLSHVDEIIVATGLGVLAMGFPIITDLEVPQLPKIETTLYEALITEKDYKKISAKCIETRGLKVKITNISVPVPYAPAFEGERVRKEQLYVEFGGKASLSFEYLTMRKMEEVQDGKIELIGSDIDKLEKESKSMPLAIVVEVAGRKMEKDFEPILERQIHRFINYAMGLMHIGQRDMNWIRISRDAYNKGFRLKHLGIILHAMLHQEYSAIVDKVQVKIYTKELDIENLLKSVVKTFAERDERLSGMTDESVDTFYSCLLCQSFAPNHVCIITPERLGLCGAYSWLDGKASYEITPTGPNQPIPKGEFIDEKLGQWKNINDFVYQKSNKTIEKVSMYSLMDNPQSSCVTSDTQVIIDNDVKNIGEFIDKNRGGEAYAKSCALTLNQGKTISERIVAMQRFNLPKDRLVRIKTKSGAEIILTAGHQLAIDRPEGLMWVGASQINKNDRIVSLKRLELKEALPDIFDLIPDNFRVRDRKLIREIKKALSKKYGSLGQALNRLSLQYFRNESISILELKIILRDLGKDWNSIKRALGELGVGCSSVLISPEIINKDLFYLMGLIASDGTVVKRGKHEYEIYFINTRKELIDRYKKTYKNIFSHSNLCVGTKIPNQKCFIKGRRVNSTKVCYYCRSSNPIFGILLEYFGITADKKVERIFKNLLNLPKEFIASFLSGLFDGDGSIRLRMYKNRWPIAEAYLCVQAKSSAYYLQWLLKRFGILSNLRKSASVYKIQMHGNNVYEFSRIINPIHKIKANIVKDIRSLYSKNRIDKTQGQVLPFVAGKILTNLRESKTILSPSTHFYYKTSRSRPILGNVLKVLGKANSPEARGLKTLADCNFYLDTVKEVKRIKTKTSHVYNLTLAETHCYFANQMLIKNCGCFECIVAILPEVNGVMVVHRDYSGMTPCGMTFTTLAGSVGGGVQTPGFLGIGKLYILSKKFISAEGGIKRLVWMPKELKELLGDKLKRRVQELGEPDLINKIADETQATTSEELISFLQKVNHPALNMAPLI